VPEFQPRVVILDIDLGCESGFDVAKRLRTRGWDASTASGRQIVLVSVHAEEDFADLLSESVAAGFVAKSDLSARAIRTLLAPDLRCGQAECAVVGGAWRCVGAGPLLPRGVFCRSGLCGADAFLDLVA
jgi:CheY-like chemotaxis protein